MKHWNAINNHWTWIVPKILIVIGMVCVSVVPYSAVSQILLNSHKITVEDGLSQNSVQDLLQDSQGFLWFGTSHGLNRYDGKSFVVFQHQEREKFSLSHSWISALLQSKTGELWIGTADGINVYNPLYGRVVANNKFPYNSVQLPKGGILSLFEDSRGWIWIGTRTDGVYCYNPKTLLLQRFTNIFQGEKTTISHGINVFSEDRNGYVWIGTDQGLSVFNPRTVTFSYCKTIEKFIDKTQIIVREIYKSKTGNLWIGTQKHGLLLFDPLTQQINKHYTVQGSSGLKSNHVLAVHEDRQNRLWVGTQEGGLFRFDPAQDKFQSCEFTSEKISMTGTNTIMRILEDSSGVLWFATNSGGLIKYSATTEGIMSYRHLPTSMGGLSHNDVLRLFEDSHKNLWIATYGGGVNIFNPATNEWQVLKHDPKNKNSIGYDYARAISEDKSGNIWIGTFGGGISCYNPKTKQFTHYKPDPLDSTSLSNNYIWATLIDKSGTLWVGSDNGGVGMFLEKTGKFRTCKKHGDWKTRNAAIQTLYQDSKANIWVGTWGNGLLLMKPDEFKLVNTFYQNLVDTSSTSFMNVVSILEDSKENLWIGTYGAGLLMYNPKSNRLLIFTDETGLPNTVIYGILEDNGGNIWASTNLGIARIHCHTPNAPNLLTSYSIMNYDISDGLQSKEFNRGAYTRLSDGRLTFGGVNGFNIINPQTLGNNPNAPRVSITNCKTFNSELQTDTALAFKKTVILDYTVSFFSISFSALEFTNPSKNRFRYRMIGLDTTWIHNGFSNTAIFTNLDPGTYQFQVIACNNDGLWNTKGATLQIIILPPVWKTWWFRTTAFIFGLLLIFVAYKRKVYKIEHQNLVLSRQVQERTNEIQRQLELMDKQAKEIQLVNGTLVQKNNELEQSNTLLEQADKYKTMVISIASHDLKNPLSAILGYAEHIKTDLNPNPDIVMIAGAIENAARRMYSLIKDLLDMSAIEMGKMSLVYEECNIAQIVIGVSEQYGLLLEKKQQTLTFEVNDPDCTTYADVERIIQVFDNIISNAIKYTPSNGKISAGIYKTTNSIIVEVCDSGPGFTDDDLRKIFGFFQPLSAKPTGDEVSTGVGLAITKQIIGLHNGEILVGNNDGHGAKFTVIIPILPHEPLSGYKE